MTTMHCKYCGKPLTVAEEADYWCERCNTDTVPSRTPPTEAPKAKRAA